MDMTVYSAVTRKHWNRPMDQFNTRAPMQCPGKLSSSSAGFSLVELMVAMVIGMLGIIVMMQMFSMFEGQKRTTTGGDDAISSGAIALYGVQRDIQQSGWGISALPLIGCNITGLAVATIPLVPVTINSALFAGQDANTDTLMIVSGNSNGTVEGDEITAHGAAYGVHTPAAFSVAQAAVAAVAGPPAVAATPAVPADRVVAVPKLRTDPVLCNPGGAAALVLTNVTSVVSPNVSVATDVAGIASGDKLFNLGPTPRVRVYAIRNQNLTVCDYTVNNCAADTSLMTQAQRDALWVPIANNVVSLRAQYGRDTDAPMDGVLNAWDRDNTLVAACDRVKVSAVRVALVARSSQPEKRLDGTVTSAAYVTPAAPAWTGNAGATIVLPSPSATWPTWQDFRYKVFQTVVPLRNITTMGAVEGC